MRAAPLLLLAAVAVVADAGLAAAQPFGVRLTHFGDATTSIAVNWNGDPAASRVRYGESADALDAERAADDTFAIGGDLRTAFTARLTGLTPDTTYHYQVGGAGGAWYPETPFTFHTMPADRCAPYTFVVIGDNRADLDGIGPNAIWSDILDEALDETPDLMLNTGDMVKNGESIEEWANFIDASEPGFAYVPTLPTMGNHDEDDVDGDGAIYNRLFEMPRNDRTATEDYYSIDVGAVHFVSLNTQRIRPGTTERDDMLAWLDADLAATTRPWKVVFFHKAVYSRGNHHTGEEHDGAINAGFVPIFDRHGVDLVFNGHSHDYERYAPARGLDEAFGGPGRTYPAGDGAAVRGRAMLPAGETATTYIVTGGAGAFTAPTPDLTCALCRISPDLCDCRGYENDVAGTVLFDGRHNYVRVDVDRGELRLTVRATEAGNLGGGALLDELSIVKAAIPEDCGTDPMPGDDAGVPGPDGGARDAGRAGADGGGRDGGRPAADGGRPAGDGGGVDAGDPSGGSDDGCGCRLSAREPTPTSALALLGALLIARLRRRG